VTARYWNEGDGSGDVRPVFAAIFAALRERAAHRSAPLTRAHRPVADDAQGANVKLGPIDSDPYRLHDHTVLHDIERTSVWIACGDGCGKRVRFPVAFAASDWTCGRCRPRPSSPPVLTVIDGGKE
jgi:hypothetical protein